MKQKLFLVTYLTFEGGENHDEMADEVIEISAFSEEQAKFLAPCNSDMIISVECVVNSYDKSSGSCG